MSEQLESMESLARQVRIALSGADLSAFSHLLDPDVRWGAPDARVPSCRNRDQVLAWYQRGRESGTRAEVTETVVLGDRILVGLTIRGPRAADAPDGETQRWQVLTVSGDLIVDIVGFDDRPEAVARAGVTSP
jgi:SnoaL-like domain